MLFREADAGSLTGGIKLSEHFSVQKLHPPPLSKIFQKKESEQLPAAANLGNVFGTHGTIFPAHQRKISLFIKYIN